MLQKPAIGIALLLFANAPVLAQEGLKPPVEGVLEGLRQAPDPQEEIRQLFRSVEKRLHAIDELLSDAGAGQTGGLANVSESGISKLIERSRASSKLAVEEIDRLLTLLESPP